MKNASVFIITLAATVFASLLCGVLMQPEQSNIETSPNLTVNTQNIEWGTFSPGSSSIRTMTATSTTNTRLTASLGQANTVDLQDYLTITCTPSSLWENEPTQITLTLTAKPNTPPLEFNVDIILTATEQN